MLPLLGAACLLAVDAPRVEPASTTGDIEPGDSERNQE